MKIQPTQKPVPAPESRLLSDTETGNIADALCKEYKTTWAKMVDGSLVGGDQEQFCLDLMDRIKTEANAKTSALVRAECQGEYQQKLEGTFREIDGLLLICKEDKGLFKKWYQALKASVIKPE